MLTGNPHQEQSKTGDVGYIDGYVQGGTGTPLAAVVIRNFVSLVPIYLLEVIERPTP